MGRPHTQREWSCTLFWLKTSFTIYWPHFFSPFQATLHIRNALKLVLKIKVAFQYHWGLSPSVLFLMFSWSRTLNQSANRFKFRVFIWGRKTSDSQPYCWLLYCWFSCCRLQCYMETRLSSLSSQHWFSKTRSLTFNNPIGTKDNTGIVIKFLRNVMPQFFTTFLGKNLQSAQHLSVTKELNLQSLQELSSASKNSLYIYSHAFWPTFLIFQWEYTT